MNEEITLPNFEVLCGRIPQAMASVRGSEQYPSIEGYVWFYQTDLGVLVVADIEGLPSEDACSSPIFAFHIHEGENCSGTSEDPFADAGTHYNPNSCTHPYHAGDLPPLFSANGNAFLAVLTDRVELSQILGRTIVIHSSPDDFTSQPAGNSGRKIACGEIKKLD